MIMPITRHGKNANIHPQPSTNSRTFEIVLNIEPSSLPYKSCPSAPCAMLAPSEILGEDETSGVELATIKLITAYKIIDNIIPRTGPIIKKIGNFRLCFFFVITLNPAMCV